MAFGKPVRRRPDEDQRIMPLINVVFLLLIFFMVAGQLSKTDPVKIDPPLSDSAQHPDDGPVRLLMTADGRVLLGDVEIDPDQVRGRVSELLRGRDKKIVDVKADGAADAGAVVAVLEKIRSAGAEKINLLTSARRAP